MPSVTGFLSLQDTIWKQTSSRFKMRTHFGCFWIMMWVTMFSKTLNYRKYLIILLLKGTVSSMPLTWILTIKIFMLRMLKGVYSSDRCAFSRNEWTPDHVKDRARMWLDTVKSSRGVTTFNMTPLTKTRLSYQWRSLISLIILGASIRKQLWIWDGLRVPEKDMRGIMASTTLTMVTYKTFTHTTPRVKNSDSCWNRWGQIVL